MNEVDKSLILQKKSQTSVANVISYTIEDKNETINEAIDLIDSWNSTILGCSKSYNWYGYLSYKRLHQMCPCLS